LMVTYETWGCLARDARRERVNPKFGFDLIMPVRSLPTVIRNSNGYLPRPLLLGLAAR
jgi:hypothetical protein